MFGDKGKKRIVPNKGVPVSLAAILLALGMATSVGAAGDSIAPAGPISYHLFAPVPGETDQVGLADGNLVVPDFFMMPGAKDGDDRMSQKSASRVDLQRPFNGVIENNGRASRRYSLFGDIDGGQLYVSREKHRGWGLAAEQKLFGHATLFARYGRSDAVTVGATVQGSAWDRSKDHVGLVFGRNEISGVPNVDTGAGQLAELYYSRQMSGDLRLVPSLQQASSSATVGGGSSMIWLRALMPF